MNRWDALSAWLYHRQNTRFQRVKSACRTLSLAEGFGEDWLPSGHASYWTRPLFELGYIEYDQGNRVIICPPGILLTLKDNHVLLSGFWSRERIANLKKSNVRLFRKQPERGPACWSIVGDSDAIREVAEVCEVWLATDPGDQILKQLPNINQWVETLSEDHSSPDGVWEVMSFRDHRPIWAPSREPFSQPGFYRRRNGEKVSVHVTATGRRRAATPDQRYVAMWYESPLVPWIYDPTKRRLYIRTGTPRLPLLIARSLVSASGCVASRVKHQNHFCWCFTGVTQKRATRAANLLCQEIVLKELEH